jgi:predicted DNA-binding transcriptional regulator AlpA
MSTQTKFVPLETVAETLSISPSTVRNCMKDGRIPDYTYFKVGKNYRFDLDTILAIFRDGKVAPPAVQQVEAKQEVTETVQKVSEKPLQTTPSPQLEFDFDADLDI